MEPRSNLASKRREIQKEPLQDSPKVGTPGRTTSNTVDLVSNFSGLSQYSKRICEAGKSTRLRGTVATQATEEHQFAAAKTSSIIVRQSGIAQEEKTKKQSATEEQPKLCNPKPVAGAKGCSHWVWKRIYKCRLTSEMSGN